MRRCLCGFRLGSHPVSPSCIKSRGQVDWWCGFRWLRTNLKRITNPNLFIREVICGPLLQNQQIIIIFLENDILNRQQAGSERVVEHKFSLRVTRFPCRFLFVYEWIWSWSRNWGTKVRNQIKASSKDGQCKGGGPVIAQLHTNSSILPKRNDGLGDVCGSPSRLIIES